MKRNYFLLAIATLIAGFSVFSACQKHITSSSDLLNESPFPPEKTVNASIQGRVLDENGAAVQGASVSSGTATTTTDVNGIFSFSRIKMFSRFGYVKVTKTGYFAGSRSVIADEGSYNFVSIQLIPRASKGSFGAASGGTVGIEGGSSAKFSEASVVDAGTGTAYTGTVRVFGAYLDPTAANLHRIMPGDLRGIDADGKETAMQSFGMMAIELEGDDGQKLQIAPGKKASLSWEIPAALQKTAPATIPLWYFNDTTGKWMEQGTAVRKGNSYVGEVGHFSYWNCDAPTGAVNFTAYLKDQHGNAVAYTYIQFTSETVGKRGGYTDSAGYAHGLIPRGENLLVEVVSECGDVLTTKNIAPLTGDADLGTISVNVLHPELTFTGTVVDCDNQPVDSGFVTALVDGLSYGALVKAGSFNLPVSRCQTTSIPVTLTAVDYVSLQKGSPVTITASTGTVDAGSLSACGTVMEEFLTVNINNVAFNVNLPPDSTLYVSIDTGTTFAGSTLKADQSNADNYTFIAFHMNILTGLGTFPTTSFTVQSGNSYYRQVPGNAIECKITKFGPVNGFIEGSLTGTINKDSTANLPLTGNFRMRRSN